MMTRGTFPLQRMRLNLSLRGKGQLMLSWKERSGGTVDPVTHAMVGGTVTDQTAGPYDCFVHQAEAKTVLRQFAEVEAGDVLLDIDAGVQVDGLENLRFTVAGEVYEQKALGGKLAKAWDVVVMGQKGLRTLLLKKAT